jgi:hypothetical protein
MACDLATERAGKLCLKLSPFIFARGHMTHMCPRVWRLGAGAPITVLQFAPLARLRSVPGFYALNGVCARLNVQGCNL